MMSGLFEDIGELIAEVVSHFLLAIVIGTFVVALNAIYAVMVLPAGSPFAATQSNAMNMFGIIVILIDAASVLGIIVAFIKVLMDLRR